MQKFIFAPCPAGNVMAETIRLYEVLQSGALPIVYHRRHFNYFEKFFGGTPLIYVSDWRQATSLMRALLDNPGRLLETSNACRSWWGAQKNKIADDYCRFLSDFHKGPKLNVNSLRLKGTLTRTLTHAINGDKPIMMLGSRVLHELRVPSLRYRP